MILLVILVSIIIGIIEGIPLIKKKTWKEFKAVLILLVIAVFFVILKILYIPTPIHILHELLYPFGKEILRHE